MNTMSSVNIQLSFAFILILCAAPVLAEESIEGLGKLFIDAEQREKLEAVRRGTYKAEAEKESRLSNIRVNGLMLRSDGENVVWINGESTLGGKEIQGLNVNPSSVDTDTYKVRVNVDGKRVNIKPGQNWSEGTGTIKDNY